MCLGVPLQIVEKDKETAVGEMNGIRRKIRIDLVPYVNIGDFVLVHAGFALEVIDEATARETEEILKEVKDAAE